MNYEDKIVAFIDILGFRGMISNTLTGSSEEQEIAIKKIKKIFDTVNVVFDIDGEDRKFSSFSDSIVVSFNVKYGWGGVYYTLKDICLLLAKLIQQGVLCRGAITMGKFIHEGKYLFGPALNEAYLLETKAALYPRIILERDVLDIALNPKKSKLSDDTVKYISNDLIKIDSDGMYYVDYFNDIVEIDEKKYSINYLAYLICLGKVIRNGLIASSHHSKSDVRVKFAWMRERYNQVIRNLKNKKLFENERDEDYHLTFAALKEISPNKGASYNLPLET